jgi:hypothetical protein
MYAFKGDRIVVRELPDTVRVAEVVAGDHVDGHPPYWVRWQDSGHETLMFPAVDADIEHAGPSYPPEYDVAPEAARSS